MEKMNVVSMKVALVYDRKIGGLYRRLCEIQRRSKYDVSIVNPLEDLNGFDIVHSYESNYIGQIHTVATYLRQAQDYFKLKSKYTLKYLFKGIKELIELSKFERIISRSQTEYNWLKEKGIASTLIQAGVDHRLFKPIEKDFRKNKTVLFLGRYERAKGIHLLMKAMEYLPDYYVLKTFSNIPHEYMPKIIPKADVLCLPSFTECFPLVILEALACNIPIVATNVGDTRYMIDPPKGGVICSHDPRNIASKIFEVTNGNDFNCRTLATRHSWEKTVSKVEKVWEETLR